MDANPGRKVKDAHAEWMQSAERSAFMAGRMGKQLWCNFGVKIHHPVVIPTGFTFETQTRWGMRMWGEHLLKKVLGFSVPTQWISSTSKPDSKHKSPRNSFWNHHDPTDVFWSQTRVVQPTACRNCPIGWSSWNLWSMKSCAFHAISAQFRNIFWSTFSFA